MTGRKSDVDVLIVGAGPVGLCCARLLSRSTRPAAPLRRRRPSTRRTRS